LKNRGRQQAGLEGAEGVGSGLFGAF